VGRGHQVLDLHEPSWAGGVEVDEVLEAPSGWLGAR